MLHVNEQMGKIEKIIWWRSIKQTDSTCFEEEYIMSFNLNKKARLDIIEIIFKTDLNFDAESFAEIFSQDS